MDKTWQLFFNKDNDLLSYPKRNDFWEKVRDWKNKGWEIAMHGYTHLYDKICKKSDDYFNYGGGSEFFGHSLETQTSKIKNGLKKFEEEKKIIMDDLINENKAKFKSDDLKFSNKLKK